MFWVKLGTKLPLSAAEHKNWYVYTHTSQPQCPRGQRRRSAAACLLRSWVRIPPGACTFVCCECCVLSGRGLCDGLITRPEESYRLWCVIVWSRNLKNDEAMARVGLQRHKNVYVCVCVCVCVYIYIYIYIYIQGVTGEMCETSGECSLGQTIPI